MTINYPGPFELRIRYSDDQLSGPVLEHIQRLNVSLVGTPAQADDFGNYEFNDINGATGVSLDTLVEDYLAVFNALYSGNNDVGLIDLWKYPTPQSFDAVFWSTYTPTANVGTAGGVDVAASQDIYTFRTQEGGVMKLSLMEDNNTPGNPIVAGSLGAAEAALVDFILNGDGASYSAPFLGRDTSYPFAFIKQFPGQNEATWKKRNGR